MIEHAPRMIARDWDVLLSRDPYSMGALVQRLLSAASNQAFDAAGRDYSILERLYPSSRSLRMLERISHGKGPISAEGQAYVARANNMDAPEGAATARHANDAIAETSRTGLKSPVLCIELIRNAPSLALLSSDIPGFHHLLLGGDRIDSPLARSTVFHEVGHAALSCGCRFLDEGWAVYFSFKGDTENVYPLARRLIPEFLEANEALVIELHALLCLPSDESLLFENITSNQRQRQLIYVQAYLFIAHLVRLGGVAAVRNLFDEIRRRQSPAQNAILVEQMIGRSVAMLHRDIFIVSEKRNQGAANTANVINGAFDALRRGDARDVWSSVSALRRARAGRGSQHDVTLVLLKLLLELNERAAVRESVVLRAEMSSLIAELERDDVTYKEFFDLKAQVADANARRSPDAIERAGWQHKGEEARRAGALALLMPGVAGEICRFRRDLPEHLPEASKGLPQADAGAEEELSVVAPTSVLIREMDIRLGKGFELSARGLECRAGEVVAIVGANGAGKTTLLSGLAGVIKPQRCEGALLGVPLSRWHTDRSARKLFGAQLQRLTQHPGLYVRDLVRVHFSLYGECDDGVALALDIKSLASKTYGSLSQGQRQRVNIYMAVAHRPRVLLLDEPTGSLDQRFRDRVRTLISEQRSFGRTVILSSHNAELVAQANRIAWIKEGKIHAFANLETLLQRYLAGFRGILECETPEVASAFHEDLKSRQTISQTFLRGPRQIVVFGGEQFRRDFDVITKGAGVVAYRFGAAGAADLLALVSGEYR